MKLHAPFTASFIAAVSPFGGESSGSSAGAANTDAAAPLRLKPDPTSVVSATATIARRMIFTRRSTPGNVVLTSFGDRRDRTLFAAAYNDPDSGITTGPRPPSPVCVSPQSTGCDPLARRMRPDVCAIIFRAKQTRPSAVP